MGMARRRTRRRTAMVVGGLAYERGRRAGQQDGYAEEPAPAYDEPAYVEPAPAPAPPPPAPNVDDATSEIERLAALHDSGALTDDEFSAAKQKVLGL